MIPKLVMEICGIIIIKLILINLPTSSIFLSILMIKIMGSPSTFRAVSDNAKKQISVPEIIKWIGQRLSTCCVLILSFYKINYL